eukprot:GHVS01097276.1.p1 GENE.GHVS01097276.1~~GHVS01097276.1.p1  ORF type:complete len:507 (-),score=119.18 GHVS01097276.1:478-1998(-)
MEEEEKLTGETLDRSLIDLASSTGLPLHSPQLLFHYQYRLINILDTLKELCPEWAGSPPPPSCCTYSEEEEDYPQQRCSSYMYHWQWIMTAQSVDELMAYLRLFLPCLRANVTPASFHCVVLAYFRSYLDYMRLALPPSAKAVESASLQVLKVVRRKRKLNSKKRTAGQLGLPPRSSSGTVDAQTGGGMMVGRHPPTAETPWRQLAGSRGRLPIDMRRAPLRSGGSSIGRWRMVAAAAADGSHCSPHQATSQRSSRSSQYPEYRNNNSAAANYGNGGTSGDSAAWTTARRRSVSLTSEVSHHSVVPPLVRGGPVERGLRADQDLDSEVISTPVVYASPAADSSGEGWAGGGPEVIALGEEERTYVDMIMRGAVSSRSTGVFVGNVGEAERGGEGAVRLHPAYDYHNRYHLASVGALITATGNSPSSYRGRRARHWHLPSQPSVVTTTTAEEAPQTLPEHKEQAVPPAEDEDNGFGSRILVEEGREMEEEEEDKSCFYAKHEATASF